MERYKCPSYYDNNNVLQDCSCGKCYGTTTPIKQIDKRQILYSKKPFDSCHYSERQTFERKENEALREAIRRF